PFAAMEADMKARQEQQEAYRKEMMARFEQNAPQRPEMPEAVAKRMEESKARRDEMVKEMEARRAEAMKQMEERRKVAMERKPFEMPSIETRKEI
ncbi:MAG: transcriptional regulator, partial [Candidatus Thiodiazotropha taylori]|nr:transcriptional regulator [Candidatus Thiodiazotropha endolucinida]MCW4230980.1 transcriptional regulator [Candidatus Thiodiazotropha taylori]